MAYHINKGYYGDASLDGLNALAIGTFEGNISAGNTKVNCGLFFDERADEKQREAIQMIFSGEAGGFMAEFAKLIGEIRGIDFAPIRFEISEDLIPVECRDSGKSSCESSSIRRPNDSTRKKSSNNKSTWK